MEVWLVVAAAFVAGVMDAMVGGGGDGRGEYCWQCVGHVSGAQTWRRAGAPGVYAGGFLIDLENGSKCLCRYMMILRVQW